MVEYAKNAFTTNILGGKVDDDRYKVVDGLIHYKGIFFLVQNSKHKDDIITSLHDIPMVGHPGFFKTYKKVGEKFTWKGLKNDVLAHVMECVICQTYKEGHSLLAGLLL